MLEKISFHLMTFPETLLLRKVGMLAFTVN